MPVPSRNPTEIDITAYDFINDLDESTTSLYRLLDAIEAQVVRLDLSSYERDETYPLDIQVTKAASYGLLERPPKTV